MPKAKTHSGASKRFRLTKNGKVKHAKQNSRHLLTKKAPKRKRVLRRQALVSKTQVRMIKRLIAR